MPKMVKGVLQIEVLRLLEIEHVSYSLFNACMEGEEYEDV